MKIKVTAKDFDQVQKISSYPYKNPKRQSWFWRFLIKTLSKGELKAVNFSYTTQGMEALSKNEPCLILMNHSSFTDLQIAGTIFADREYHIVCTNDGFVGKESLMRDLGCIPTRKFITDITLLKSMQYVFDKLHASVLMYPEASYSFDGTQTPLPFSLVKSLKLFNVPVVMIKTHGAFLRDPLYNNLQKRNVTVTAEVKYILSPKDITEKSVEELYEILSKEFDYNHFAEQLENNILITEPFRADGLNRVLYKCPHCLSEGYMKGRGINLKCEKCGSTWELLPNGNLQETSVNNGEIAGNNQATSFTSIPEWYKWERQKVKEEILAGTYKMEEAVEIMILKDLKSIYKAGEGKLLHTRQGFELTGCNGKLQFKLSGKASYSLYADYFWYELGDMICIGDTKTQYYCFPKNQEKAIVAKARLATEEIYKLTRLFKLQFKLAN